MSKSKLTWGKFNLVINMNYQGHRSHQFITHNRSHMAISQKNQQQFITFWIIETLHIKELGRPTSKWYLKLEVGRWRWGTLGFRKSFSPQMDCTSLMLRWWRPTLTLEDFGGDALKTH